MAYPAVAHPGLVHFKDLPEYRSGRAQRLSGILITSIGTGLSVLSISIGAMLIDNNWYGNDKDAGGGFVLGGLIGAGVSLGLGIPLWISGQSKINAARRSWSAQMVSSLGVAPTRSGGVQLSTGWRF